MNDVSRMNETAALIERAMSRSAHIARQAAEEHSHAFAAQMREKIGVEKIALDEPYLPFLLVRSELRYLRRMERLGQRLTAAKSHPLHAGCCIEHKEDDAPAAAQIDAETNRAVIETKQDLDSARQQAFGITHYVWSGGDCAECASKDGEIFAWGEGEEPGGVHQNCACSAEPALEGAGDPNPPSVSNDDILNMALLLTSFSQVGLARRIGVAAVQGLGSVGRRVLARLRRSEEEAPPPQKPQATDPVNERPKNVPEDWVQMPADKKEGTKYVDPNNPHNDLRIQKGNPNSQYPNQRGNYVRWKKNGQWLDKNGNPSTDPEKTHIPIKDFNFDLEIFK